MLGRFSLSLWLAASSLDLTSSLPPSPSLSLSLPHTPQPYSIYVRHTIYTRTVLLCGLVRVMRKTGIHTHTHTHTHTNIWSVCWATVWESAQAPQPPHLVVVVGEREREREREVPFLPGLEKKKTAAARHKGRKGLCSLRCYTHTHTHTRLYAMYIYRPVWSCVPYCTYCMHVKCLCCVYTIHIPLD